MDDLLDLNFSASPSSALSSRPSSAKPNINTPHSSAFDNLLKPSAPNYSLSPSITPIRSSTPQTAPIPQLAKLGVPPRPSSGTGNRPSPAPASVAAKQGDAFSSLFSLEGSLPGNGKESMAERAKRIEREKREEEDKERKKFEHGDFWEKFGESSTSATKGSGGTSRNQGGLNAFEDLLQPSPAGVRTRSPAVAPEIIAPKPSAAPTRTSKGTFWDMQPGLLSSQARPSSSTRTLSPAASSSRSTPAPPADPFDFDMLSDRPILPSTSPAGREMSTRTPVGQSAWGDGDDLDILGDLARPIARQNLPENDVPRPSTSRPSTARSSSPPPHIIGQIVEMGFSPAQARTALAKTDSGLDVQAALELLLGSQPESSTPQLDSGSEDDEAEAEEAYIQRERAKREEAERERRRARRAGPSRETVSARTRDEIRSAEMSGRGTPDYGEQAEKYLAQASEIGTTVLSKASSFWAAGKERAAKLLEEQRRQARERAQVEGGNRREVKDGRPRWMIDAESDAAEGEEREEVTGSGEFRDEDTPPRPRRDGNTNGDTGGKNGMSIKQSEAPEQYRSVKERADLLFADEPKPYVPASRRKAPGMSFTTSNGHAGFSRPTRPISPISLITRQLVSASPAQMERAATAKAKGNEHFKLGRFAESESAYTTAISALPPGHLHLIALHNNRAASRLKLGESSGTIEDCSTVLEIIGPAYHPSKETPLPPDYADVKLAESMVKALTKRAQAYEMGEKWKLALEDWEKVMGLDSAFLGNGQSGSATKNMAAEGARRSRRMMEGGDPTPTASSSTARQTRSAAVPKPKPQPTATRAKPPITSAAVKDLRAANLAREKEDAQKAQLKDTVESKLAAWKGGKETNLRALIASLDLVLWESVLSGVKVGMHELISEKQVKIKYMKVIARLHPDKLDVKNTTVEQRMIANEVFGTLNEAWQAFQNGS